MSEKQNKILKSILIVIAIIFAIVALVFAFSKFIVKQDDSGISLNLVEYRIQESEITSRPADENLEEHAYTSGEVIIEIQSSVLDEFNINRNNDELMSLEYQLIDLEGNNPDTEWIDYTGEIRIDHNVKIRTRLICPSEEDFKGPITEKEITQIQVAKITKVTGLIFETTYYSTLENAIEACEQNAGNLVTLIEMVADTQENVVIPQGKNIVINTYGFTINSQDDTTDPTITVSGKLGIIDTQDDDNNTQNNNTQQPQKISGVYSQNGNAINVNTTGELSLGINETEPSVSITKPVISGATNGIAIQGNGIFNFYDGKIIAPLDENENNFGTKTINGVNSENNDITGHKDVTQTPTNYIVNIENDGNGNEIATLVRTHIVTFDANGGNVEFENKRVILNKEYGELPDVNKQGAVFKEWVVADDFISSNSNDWENKSLKINGNIQYDTNRIKLKENIAILPNTKYKISVENDENLAIRIIHFYDENNNFINYIQGESGILEFTNKSFITPENAAYMNFTLKYTIGNEIPIEPEQAEQANISLVKPIKSSTIVTIPYNHTITAQWGESYYAEYNGETIIKYYSTLENAMSEVTSGNTIKPIKNVTDFSEPQLEQEKIATIDLNGFTITTNNTIKNYGILTITGTGIIQNANENATENTIENNGTLTINEGTIKGKTCIINKQGTLTLGTNEQTPLIDIQNPCIIGNTTGVNIESGIFNFYDGIIKAPTDHTIIGTITQKPIDYCILKGSEQINNRTYETAYLTPYINVGFNPNNGEVELENKKVAYGQTYGELPIPTREEYDFDGWIIDNTETIEWTKGYLDDETGEITESAEYPNAYYTNFIGLQANKRYELEGYGNYASDKNNDFRWKVYDATGQYLGCFSNGYSYQPEQQCYVKILFFKTSTQEQRKNTVIKNQDKRIIASSRITEDILVSSTIDHQLIARWKPQNYDIIYELNEGTAENLPQQAKYNENVILNQPTREGYRFAGWTSSIFDGIGNEAKQVINSSDVQWNGNLANNTTFKNLAKTPFNDQTMWVKMTANWRPEFYDITYELNGGTLAENTPTRLIYNNSSYVRIYAPTREGYEFTGWTSSIEDGLSSQACLEGGFSDPLWDGSLTKSTSFRGLADLPTTDEVIVVKFTANWIPAKRVNYDINYEFKGGTPAANTPETAQYNTYVSVGAPTREGYQFIGWTSSIEDGLGENACLYGSFRDTLWTGFLTTNGTFRNLAPEARGEQNVSVTLTANWRIMSYNITYELNGGTLAENTPTVGVYNQYITINPPTKEGYKFIGWTSSPEDGLGDARLYGSFKDAVWTGFLTTNGTVYNLAPFATGEERNTVKLTANWRYMSYNITYELNGGTLAENTPTVGIYDYNITINQPTREGYEFIGWTTSTEDGLGSNAQIIYNSSSPIWDGSLNSYTLFRNLAPITTGEERYSVKLTANWRNMSYDITYDSNGGTLAENTPTVGIYGYNITINQPTREGYQFIGWTTSTEDGLGSNARIIYNSSSPIWDGSLNSYTLFRDLAPITTGEDRYSVKLTANWRNMSYDITYDSNGGTLAENTPTVGIYGDNIIINQPTREGYEFIGWTTSTEDGLGSNAQIIYNSSSPIWDGSLNSYTIYRNLAPITTGEERYSVKLTANWKNISYDITYDSNGGTLAENTPTVGIYNQDIIISHPTKQGYEFIGWTSSSEDGLGSSAQLIDYRNNPMWDGSLSSYQRFKNLAPITTGEERYSVKLTANWKNISYDITYELNGGILAENTPTVGIYNQNIIIGHPTKQGYEFIGWTSSPEDGLGSSAQLIDDRNNPMWNGSLSLYQKFMNLAPLATGEQRNSVKLTANWAGGPLLAPAPKSLRFVKPKITENQNQINSELNNINQNEIDNNKDIITPQVVQINNTTYPSISQALNNANNGDEIKILENLELTEEIVINSDKNITINLNNKTITSNSTNVINNQGTLTIKEYGIIKNEVENGVVIYNTGNLNIEKAIITTTANGGKAISNYSNNNSETATINISGGKVVTEGIGAIGIYNINKSICTITGGIFETRGYGSKAIYNDSKLEIEKAEIIVSEDNSIGIYNSKYGELCVIKQTNITVEAEEIENYELIKNTDEFKQELEKMEPSYGIYNYSDLEVIFESGTMIVERLKGVGIKNDFEGSITLGKQSEEINAASPIIYAISDNTTAIINSEKGQINFYDGKVISISSVKNIFTKLLENSEIVEEIGSSNIVCYLKKCQNVIADEESSD